MTLSRLRERLASLLPHSFRGFVAARRGSHRAFVGPIDEFDESGASQFNLLTLLGLREQHFLLDVGCGALRAGRLFIAYLQPDRYFGVEPERWLVESALQAEIGRDALRLKRPRFDHNAAFRLSVFDRTFDFVLASSIFSHAAPAQIRTCLEQAYRVTHRSSLVLASYVPGSTDHGGDAWRYPETVTYTLERMREWAADARLECEPIDWPYVYGKDRQQWLAFAHSP